MADLADIHATTKNYLGAHLSRTMTATPPPGQATIDPGDQVHIKINVENNPAPPQGDIEQQGDAPVPVDDFKIAVETSNFSRMSLIVPSAGGTFPAFVVKESMSPSSRDPHGRARGLQDGPYHTWLWVPACR
jgi:hypothetical protein